MTKIVILLCAQGQAILKAHQIGWIDFNDFNLEEYEYFEQAYPTLSALRTDVTSDVTSRESVDTNNTLLPLVGNLQETALTSRYMVAGWKRRFELDCSQ